MPAVLPGAPASVTAALDRLYDELSRAAAENFAGLILYGGLARGQFRPGKSDVNVVVICTKPPELRLPRSHRRSRRRAGRRESTR